MIPRNQFPHAAGSCGGWLVAASLATCAVALFSPDVRSAPQDDRPTPSADSPKAGPDRLQWWRDARFGLFIHWGPVSLKGTEIGWSRGGERRGTGGTGTIPVEVYDHLYETFDPVRFNADEWVAIAQAAGMKYLVFTTKHHDGFSMFDSKLTDYKITRSPFNRDVVAELADACHRAGLRLGFYYSPPDWHHPDYRTDRHEQYVRYLHGQLRELCSHYGQVDVIWFDGLGGKPDDWDSKSLFEMIHQLQPNVLINNRAGLPADFDTPEQRVGKFQIDRPWESCITLGQQWAFKPDDQIKSLEKCVRTLVRCAGGDGNLLLNVGPTPSGEIEPRQVERLKEMGRWLKQYGQSIYKTRGGPFMPGPWGASTRRDNTIYLHVFQWPGGHGTGEGVSLPALDAKVLSASALTGGSVKVRQTARELAVMMPPSDRDPINTMIALQVDRPAGELEPIRVPSDSLAAGRKATASNTFRNHTNFGPDKAVDDDDATRWATDAGTRQAWLEIDLGQPAMFNSAAIREAYRRVRAFRLRARNDGDWQTVAEGTRIGDHLQLQFAPVTARVVRLEILDAVEGPTIWEFQLFNLPRKDH